jgi:hypothetical protein
MLFFIGMVQSNQGDPNESQRSSQTVNGKRNVAVSKPRRKYAMVLIVLIAVILAALGGFVYYYKHDYSFSGYRYTVVYTMHQTAGPVTRTILIVNTTWRSTYNLGERFSLNVPFFNNGSATSKISNISCGTPGFSFIGSSIVFPIAVPYAPNASVANVTVRLTFSTPWTPYSGPFIYTAYFDDYPLPPP